MCRMLSLFPLVSSLKYGGCTFLSLSVCQRAKRKPSSDVSGESGQSEHAIVSYMYINPLWSPADQPKDSMTFQSDEEAVNTIFQANVNQLCFKLNWLTKCVSWVQVFFLVIVFIMHKMTALLFCPVNE